MVFPHVFQAMINQTCAPTELNSSAAVLLSKGENPSTTAGNKSSKVMKSGGVGGVGGVGANACISQHLQINTDAQRTEGMEWMHAGHHAGFCLEHS